MTVELLLCQIIKHPKETLPSLRYFSFHVKRFFHFYLYLYMYKSYSNSTKRYFLNLKTQVSHSFLTPVQGKLETVSSKESLTKAHFREIYMGDGEVC